jgi:hypothetical protein
VQRSAQDFSGLQLAPSPQDPAQHMQLLRKLKAGMEHAGRTVKANATTVPATFPSLVAPTWQTRSMHKTAVRSMRSGRQRSLPASAWWERCTDQALDHCQAQQHSQAHQHIKGLQHRFILRSIRARRVSQMCGTATAVCALLCLISVQGKAASNMLRPDRDCYSALTYADENSAGKGRSAPGQQHAGGGSRGVTASHW